MQVQKGVKSVELLINNVIQQANGSVHEKSQVLQIMMNSGGMMQTVAKAAITIKLSRHRQIMRVSSRDSGRLIPPEKFGARHPGCSLHENEVYQPEDGLLVRRLNL